MSFLPIVARELRVTARRSRTYWVRLLVAFIAITIGVVLLAAYSLSPQARVGKTLFQALSGLAFVYCLFAGRLSTADSISVEKREGTLGLLFLTDLKGYDIVLGKIVATSLNSFYALLAIFPVLGLPLLLGGMTNGEFGRMVVVLVSTFLLSLAIGVFASALSRDARGAHGGNLLLTLSIMAILPWLGAYVFARNQGVPLTTSHFIASPAFGFYSSADLVYAASPGDFWWSIGIIQGWTWLLVLLASWVVPRSWQDQPSLPRGMRRTWRGFWRSLSYGSPAKQKPFRKRLLDVNGFYWLAARARLKPLHVWLLIAAAAAWWIAGWYLTDDRVWLDASVGITMAILLNFAIKIWVAIEAGQQLAEDRRSGAMELLLPTSLTVRDILKGQVLALRRQFLGPLLVIVGVESGFMFVSLHGHYETETLCLWLAGISMLLVDVAALAITAMGVALTAKNPQQMILATFGRILILPWIAFGMICVLAGLWKELFSTSDQPFTWKFYLSLWVGLGLVADIGFGFLAGRRLLTRFREFASGQFESRIANRKVEKQLAKPVPTTTATNSDETISEHSPTRRIRSPRWKRIVCATGLVVLLAGCVLGYRTFNKSTPMPVEIPLPAGRDVAATRVYPGRGGVLIIPPDGSLWRWGGGYSPGSSKARTPIRIGTVANWLEVHTSLSTYLGIQRNGTLWSWGIQPGGTYFSGPTQIGIDEDWAAVYPGDSHHAAIKRDGTVWMWGDNRWGQLGDDQIRMQVEPAQVGTNHHWKSVAFSGNGTIGLRTDGSLWFWGSLPYLTKGARPPHRVVLPMMICSETNWVDLKGDFALNSKGEWWNLFYDMPDPATSITNNGRLFSDEAMSGHLTFGIITTPALSMGLYELRDDRTLWKTPFMRTYPPTVNPSKSWQRFDGRHDWIGLWSSSTGGGGAVFGMTADGTLWTWGIDLGAEPRSSFRMRLNELEAKITRMFGSMPRGGVSSSGMPPIQIEPRPLIKFVKAPQ